MTVGAYDNCYTSGNGCPTDAGDKGRKYALTDAQRVGLTGNTNDVIADTNVAIARSESSTGEAA